MRLIPIVLVYLLNLITPSFNTTLEDLKDVFNGDLCKEGNLDGLIVPNKEDSNTKNIISLASVGIAEENQKPVLLRLNELASHNNIDYYFTLLKEEGPAHAKLFTIELTLGKENYIGEGRSHKKAKQEAGAKALELTEYEFPKLKEKKTPKDIEKLTPTVLLNNIGSKLGVVITYYLLDKDKQEVLHSNIILTEKSKSYLQKLNESIYNDKKLHLKRDIESSNGPFRIKLEFGEHVFHATSHSIQSGRHEVAKLALDFLAKNKDSLDFPCLKEGFEHECKQDKERLKSPISKVYEEGQKRKIDVEFEVLEESGPAHKRTFSTECRFGDITTTGEGTSKKESKRIAAEYMLEKIKTLEPLPFDSEYNSDKPKDKKKRKKKKKLIKNKLDEISLTLDSVKDSLIGFAKNIFGDDEQQANIDENGNEMKTDSNSIKSNDKDDSQTTKSDLNQLLELSKVLKFEVGIRDFGDDKKHGSVLSLYMNPEYICFGEARTEFLARNAAAKNALEFLTQKGIYDLFLEQKQSTLESEIKQETRYIHSQLVREEKQEL
ncbi:unnamed protein product [Phyllotreta striolata]|uniref:DRBM domain-containing protein n=1 Tax=Phyllotreta striolata TaxID=444603 RepID=A0A9N9XRW0_PHYSR|nr:unnamed protein product [Phyllotreta striolata]